MVRREMTYDCLCSVLYNREIKYSDEKSGISHSNSRMNMNETFFELILENPRVRYFNGIAQKKYRECRDYSSVYIFTRKEENEI